MGYSKHMAQIELRFFTALEPDKMLGIARVAKAAVANAHYGLDEPGPGVITLIVPSLAIDMSESDASYELEISESSDNWPRDPATGELLTHDPATEALGKRAEVISAALRASFASESHNIFEVTGIATGWVQYKPE